MRTPALVSHSVVCNVDRAAPKPIHLPHHQCVAIAQLLDQAGEQRPYLRRTGDPLT
jgi:hypothetical protein